MEAGTNDIFRNILVDIFLLLMYPHLLGSLDACRYISFVVLVDDFDVHLKQQEPRAHTQLPPSVKLDMCVSMTWLVM